jgi:hypothetical protein
VGVGTAVGDAVAVGLGVGLGGTLVAVGSGRAIVAWGDGVDKFGVLLINHVRITIVRVNNSKIVRIT